MEEKQEVLIKVSVQELKEKKTEIKLTYIMEVVSIIYLLSFLINRVIEDFTVKGIVLMPSFFAIAGVVTSYYLIKSVTESYMDKKAVYEIWIDMMSEDE